MRLNYVSILRGTYKFGLKNQYYIRGELEREPTTAWFRYFQLLWISNPSYRKICSEPLLNGTDIILPISDSEQIDLALEALKQNVERVGEPHVSLGNLSCLRAIYEAIIYAQPGK